MFIKNLDGCKLYKSAILYSCVIERLKIIIERILGIKLDEKELQLTEVVGREFKIPELVYGNYEFRLYFHDSIHIIIRDRLYCTMIKVDIIVGEKVDICIEGNVNNCKELDNPFVKLKKELITLQEELSVICNKKFGDFIRMSLYDVELELQYIHSEKFISDSISIHDFLKYSEDDCIDDINYSKKIYRISDDTLFPLIEGHLQYKFKVGKIHRLDNVQRSKLFYIENFDLQDITTPGCDDLDFMVDNDGYRIINITH